MKYLIFLLILLSSCATHKPEPVAINGGVEIYEVGGEADPQVKALKEKADKRAKFMSESGFK